MIRDQPADSAIGCLELSISKKAEGYAGDSDWQAGGNEVYMPPVSPAQFRNFYGINTPNHLNDDKLRKGGGYDSVQKRHGS